MIYSLKIVKHHKARKSNKILKMMTFLMNLILNFHSQKKKLAKIKNILSINMLANPIVDEMGEGFKTEILMFY